MKVTWKSLATIIFIIVLIAVQLLYWLNPITLSDIMLLHDELLTLVNDYPFFSVSIYILLYALSIIFGIPISATIVGGYFFGFVGGAVYSLIGILIGTTVLCYFVRYVISDWIQQRYKDKLRPLNKEIKKYGLQYIMMIHAVPFIPSFLPSIAASLSTVFLYKIISFTVIGATPLTLIYATAGKYIRHIDSLKMFVYYVSFFGTVLGLLFLISIVYRHYLDEY